MKLIKVPSSLAALTKKGSDKGPDVIVKELYDVFLNEDGKKINFEIDSVKIVEQNIETTNQNIYDKFEEHSIFIGGDHSITYPLFKAFSKKYSNPGLIILDAHPDCENSFSPPSHEDFLRVLIEEGIVKKENVILVGLRNWDGNEFKFLKENRIRYYRMKDLFNNYEEICDAVMEKAREFDGLYLSVDVDVADCGIAPGTGYIEPGGMTSRELLYFLQRLKLLKNLKAVDVVEVNPDKDFNNMTSKLAAKVIMELSS